MLTHAEIKTWLDSVEIKNYTIGPDGIVDVRGDVSIYVYQFKGTTLPIQFGHVSGLFNCNNSTLVSLQGAPRSVGSYFNCYGSNITSLKGAPQSIIGSFSCVNTDTSSLEGCPQSVGGSFYCTDTKITSLHDIHKQIKHIGGSFHCDSNITHLLGILLIDGITEIDVDDGGSLDKIFNKYVGTGDILSAQDELIDAGFIEQARL
jgi:hypothetical protein